ncbi:glycosyltransferase [Rhodopila sp.]|uniref:glycosyltransferase n=1 Tax=Rhodopila sp. TaxID=2480087 RepID=UPI002B89A3BF|nr:glycosyltransferase [Rhodopila sp.]HVZ06461.1 glycosyltransferase [Rhodopila sp.]
MRIIAGSSAKAGDAVKVTEQAAARQGEHAAPLVVHIFPTFAVGGAQVRFAAIANHFGLAFRHIVVALDGNTACRERLRPDLDIRFPVIEAPKHAMLANAWRFRRLLRAWRPDMLVTCNWGAIEFALADLLPVSPHFHVVDGFGPEERAAQIPRRVRLRRLALGRTPVVLPSRTLVRIATDIWKLRPSLIRYVPNGVDLARFTVSTRAAVGEPVIGTIAALREEKNIARLLRAFALATRGPPARLVIVGDGPERAALTALAAQLGIAERVEFTGHQADTPAFYRRFDIFALSSDTEQMPLSVIEAMASGLPVVSTDVGDVRMMVAERNVPLVTRLDDAALASALAALAADPDLRMAIGAANRDKACRDFDEQTMFATYGALWRGSGPAR